MRRLLAALSVLAALASPVLAQNVRENAPPQANREDKDFLDFVAEDNQAEIQLCLLAQRQATSPAVKAFARLMVHDHVGIESRLAALANAHRVSVSNGIGHEGQETLSRLRSLQGEAFDREFMRAQIEDHHHDLDRFKQQQSGTRNEALSRFAAETVSMLDQHHRLAQIIAASLQGGQTPPGR